MKMRNPEWKSRTEQVGARKEITEEGGDSEKKQGHLLEDASNCESEIRAMHCDATQEDVNRTFRAIEKVKVVTKDLLDKTLDEASDIRKRMGDYDELTSEASRNAGEDAVRMKNLRSVLQSDSNQLDARVEYIQQNKQETRHWQKEESKKIRKEDERLKRLMERTQQVVTKTIEKMGN